MCLRVHAIFFALLVSPFLIQTHEVKLCLGASSNRSPSPGSPSGGPPSPQGRTLTHKPGCWTQGRGIGLPRHGMSPLLPSPLSPALREGFRLSLPIRGGEGLNFVCLGPRAAVASLPCPGLHSLALSGPKTGLETAFQAAPASSEKDMGHDQPQGRGAGSEGEIGTKRSSSGFVTLAGNKPEERPLLTRFEDSRVSMACTYTVLLYGKDPKQLPLITNAALDEADRIDALMSNYKPESPLSQINREAGKGPVRVEPELFRFLKRCVEYSRESDGAFDITVGPLMKTWGFFRNEGRVPWPFEIGSVLRHVGYQYLKLDVVHRTIQFEKEGMEIDLGGIAKGYAVDRIVEILKEQKIESAFISAGGSTLYGLGTPPDRPGWEVKLRDPLSPHDPKKSPITVLLKDRCLSVSGNYEKFFIVRGVTYSHIMNPKTGSPVENMFSVAVLTQNGTDGDALDDSFYVLGFEKSKALLAKYSDTEVFFFLPAGEKQWKMDRLSSAARNK